MKLAAWLARCGLAGAMAMLFVSVVVTFATLGIDLTGKLDRTWQGIAAIASLPVGLVAGLVLGIRYFRASNGRPASGAWSAVIIVGAVPLAILLVAGNT